MDAMSAHKIAYSLERLATAFENYTRLQSKACEESIKLSQATIKMLERQMAELDKLKE